THPRRNQPMRRPTRSLALVLALGLLVPALGHAATWDLDPAHSSVSFAIRHMMISTVRGQFRAFTGKAVGDPASPSAASIEASIDAASIDTSNEKRDAHLKT